MTTPTVSSNVRSQYFQDAALLRWCLEFNRADFRFAKDGGRIVYLLDANIVRFFISPEQETRHVTPFRAERSPPYAAATALITAEFLFSRALTGQGYGPSFIAPTHGEEIGFIASAIARETAQNRLDPKKEDWSGDVRAARAVVRAFNKGDLDRVQAAAELKLRVPRVAELILGGSFQWAVQLRRLYEEDLLRPLALHTEATQDILEPDRTMVLEWIQRISDERHPETRRERERVERDAEALVQTLLLDQEATSEQGGCALKYVLVTADHALLDAFTKWFWGPERPSRQRFVLRLPLQYAPILNSYEMPNDIESVTVTDRAFAALDSLFENLRRVDHRFVERLLLYRLLAREPAELQQRFEHLYGFNPFALDSTEAFDEARRQWDDSFRAGVVLNARLMNRRTQEFDFLETLLRDDVNLREEIYQHQARCLERIEAAHTAYATRLNVRMLRAGKGFAAAQRAYPAIRAIFPALGGRTVTEILDGIAAGDTELLDGVDRRLAEEDSQAYFLAGCIAHRCGHWSAAGIYTARALELITREDGPDDVSGEISFLHASTIRYALASSPPGDEARLAEVHHALSVLEDAEKNCEASGDAFGCARALSERCALRIMRLYYRWLSELSSPGNEVEQLKLIYPDLERAGELIAHCRQVVEPEPVMRLERQRISNLISTWIYAKALAPGQPEALALQSVLKHDPINLVAQHREAGTNKAPLIMEAECELILLVAGRSSLERTHAVLASIAHRGRVDDSLLEMDRAEIARFRDVAEYLATAHESA